MSKRGRARSFERMAGVRLTREQLDWLEGKVRKGEFASVSHGIRRCVDLVMRGEVKVE